MQNSKSDRITSNAILIMVKIDNEKIIKDSYIKTRVKLKKAIATYNADDIDERVKEKQKCTLSFFPKLSFWRRETWPQILPQRTIKQSI